MDWHNLLQHSSNENIKPGININRILCKIIKLFHSTCVSSTFDTVFTFSERKGKSWFSRNSYGKCFGTAWGEQVFVFPLLLLLNKKRVSKMLTSSVKSAYRLPQTGKLLPLPPQKLTAGIWLWQLTANPDKLEILLFWHLTLLRNIKLCILLAFTGFYFQELKVLRVILDDKSHRCV